MTRETVITFGCRLNTYESEIIKNIIKKEGLEDIAVFNTCCVTNEAERQAVQAIRKYKRENPNISITVTGCAVHINPNRYLEMPEVDRVLNNKEKLLAKSYTNSLHKDEDVAPFLYGFETKRRALVQIQNGCNHRCAFCIIPYARGNSKSTPIAQIIEQVGLLVEQGHVEIVLTGINITSYGKDFAEKLYLGKTLKELLREVPDLKRLRLSSIDVSEIDDDLFELITTEKRFMPYLHLSLQSGDDHVLRKMRRRHTREQSKEFCQKVRKLRPDLGFGADIITGFPTETDEQFKNTCDLIEEIKIPYMHVFPYSERYDTPAARMPQIDKKIRKDRAKILRSIGKNNLDEFSESYIGKEALLLLEKNNIGRMENFLKVTLSDKNLKPGQLVKVKIIDYKDSNLSGVVIA
jgi:threonylcarbamoyladenosine tRNA methylthiotransferase MtaB